MVYVILRCSYVCSSVIFVGFNGYKVLTDAPHDQHILASFWYHERKRRHVSHLYGGYNSAHLGKNKTNVFLSFLGGGRPSITGRLAWVPLLRPSPWCLTQAPPTCGCRPFTAPSWTSRAVSSLLITNTCRLLNHISVAQSR